MALYVIVDGERRDITKVGAVVRYRNGQTIYCDTVPGVLFWIKNEPETAGRLTAMAFSTRGSRPRTQDALELLHDRLTSEVSGVE